MNQEAIELLAEAELLLKTESFMECCAAERCEECVTKALTLFKQPPAGDFTENLRKFVKLYENEVPRRAEITFLEEACEIIDKLLEQQPPAGEWTKEVRINFTTHFENPDWVIHKKLMEACEIIDRVVAERDLAIAHDRQPYPPAGEFTKELRLRWSLRPKIVDSKIAAKDVFDLCDRLDRAASINKDLLAACELALHNEHKRWAEIKAVLVAAIAKAK